MYLSWQIPSLLLALSIVSLMKSQFPLLGIIYQKVTSLWNLAICVKVHAPGGTIFQPVSWNHSWCEDSWKWNHYKDWEFFPMVIFEGQEANGKEEAMACRVLPLICSVWHQPRLRHVAMPWLQRRRCSVMAHHGTGSSKHSPLLVCGVVWGTLLHVQVMDPSSVLLQWNP